MNSLLNQKLFLIKEKVGIFKAKYNVAQQLILR